MTDHLAHLASDAAAVTAVLRRADLDAPVAGCGDWRLRDLAVHLGQVHRWATDVVRTRDRAAEVPASVADADLADWFAEGAATLQEVLARADPDAPCWTFGPDRRVAFWVRRQALETAVHRVDAERAVGAAAPVADDLAEDGVDEVVTVFYPRQVSRGRTPAPSGAARLVSTATGRGWVLGLGEPTATVSGSPEELLLLVWRRRGRDGLAVEGDLAVLDALLASALTP